MTSIEHNFCQFDASTDSCPYDFTALANDVAFIALVPGIGFGLWRTDGSRAGTTLIRDVNSIRLFSNLVAGNEV